MNKHILLFLAVYGALLIHKHHISSPLEALSQNSNDGLKSAHERLRDRLAQEQDSPGELTQSFEKIVSHQKETYETESLENAVFDTGEFEFLASHDENPESFYPKLLRYAVSEEANNFWTQKKILEYAQSRKERDQNTLIQIALSVFDNQGLLKEKISSEDLRDLEALSLEILQYQITSPQEFTKLEAELKQRGYEISPDTQDQ